MWTNPTTYVFSVASEIYRENLLFIESVQIFFQMINDSNRLLHGIVKVTPSDQSFSVYNYNPWCASGFIAID